MKIESLTFERYGRFADRTLTFSPEARLHVVMGANESGKTTALSAIADLLFGFGQRTPYDFQHEGKLLRIGADLRLADGRTLSVRRRKGNKNTLIDASDQPLPDDLLTSLLGSVTRDTFTREFGLTAEALREGGHELLKAGGKLGETLAAGSARLTALSQLRTRLAEEADRLFTPRKSASKEFYMALERHEQADRKLRDAIVTADALQAADAAIEAAEAELNTFTEEHDKAGRDLKKLERCGRTRKLLAELQGLNHELQKLDALPRIAAQMVADWRAALTADHEAMEALRALDETDAADTAEIEALAIDDNLLRCGAEIDALRERLGAVRKAIEDLPKRVEARRIAIDELDQLARRLGMSSHEILLAKRPSDPALDHARQLVEARKRADDKLQETEDRHAKAVRALHELTAETGTSTHPTDPALFRQRLESVASVPGDARQVARNHRHLRCGTQGHRRGCSDAQSAGEQP